MFAQEFVCVRMRVGTTTVDVSDHHLDGVRTKSDPALALSYLSDFEGDAPRSIVTPEVLMFRSRPFPSHPHQVGPFMLPLGLVQIY